MGAQLSAEQKNMATLEQTSGSDFPGSDYHPSDRKNWMAGLDLGKLTLNKIVWPGTHNSATYEIGIPLITRPFAECQSMSIYEQLVNGVRVLDIRVQEDRLICHGIIKSYNSADVVLEEVKRFLSETQSEIIILEFRTEFGYENPPDFDKFLVEKLGPYLIHQDDRVFEKTVSELLPKRVICLWRPKDPADSPKGGPLWGSEYLKGEWTDTDQPHTKFERNLELLAGQPPVSSRKFFYRVEHTLTVQVHNPMLLRILNDTMKGYARLFIKQCFVRNIADRLQILSADFIETDFVDACVGLTYARIQGNA